MGLFNRKNKQIIKKLKNQTIELPDGSKVKMKIVPKIGNKSKVEIIWNKKIEDIDLYISFKGQPIRSYQEGFVYDPNGEEYAKFELGAKTKF